MLDFSQVVPQIQTFAGNEADTRPQWHAALEEAGRRLRESGPNWLATQARIADSRTSWLLAEFLEPPDTVYAAPPRPTPCTVFAADGSQIVGERHDIALCYLLNVGLIALRYGTGERALLSSRPYLSAPDDSLLDDFHGEQSAIAPRRLAMRRALREFAGLAELVESFASLAEPPHPSLALFDGSLILWPLETEKEDFKRETLTEFQQYLQMAQHNRVPVAGYISASQSRDVLNALRVFHCPHPKSHCEKICPNHAKPRPQYVAPECAGTERITDTDLFSVLLRPGERSAVFGSQSKILNEYAPEQRIRFFYLHAGAEIARIEIPVWVADDAELLALTHILCWDQAQKGDGYPVALAEAHEQAVIRAPERDAFFQLMEREFVRGKLPVSATRKALAKRARRV